MNRRALFRRTIQIAAASVLARSLDVVFPEHRTLRRRLVKTARADDDFEMYDSFVLLESDAEVPSFVTDATNGPPNMCGVSDDGSTANPGTDETVDLTTYESASDMASDTDVSVYHLPSPASGLVLHEIVSIRHESGALYGGHITYKSNDPIGSWRTSIDISFVSDHADPLPIWKPDSDDSVQDLQEVEYTPNPGLVMEHPDGSNVIMWIRNGIFYRVISDNSPYSTPEDLVEALSRVDP